MYTDGEGYFICVYVICIHICIYIIICMQIATANEIGSHEFEREHVVAYRMT